MRGIKPIPKNTLIHTVEYHEHIGSDGWNDTFADPITIEFVRVDPVTSIQQTGNSEDIVAKHIVIMDRVHTKPFIHLKEKSKITFNGADSIVHKVNPFYDFRPDPHHYEVELV